MQNTEITDLYAKISRPAQRALQSLNLKELKDLGQFTRKQIADLHGVGPSALKLIESEMKEMNLTFLKAVKTRISGSKPNTIDEYIQMFPASTQAKLQELRALIRTLAPEAIEKISYQMPTFYLFGNLVHFAAYERHIGFYPAPSGIVAFADELVPYKYAKGSLQFPLDQPLPLPLIRKIVAFRIHENSTKAAAKKDKK